MALEPIHAALYALFVGANYLTLVVALNRRVDVRTLVCSRLALLL